MANCITENSCRPRLTDEQARAAFAQPTIAEDVIRIVFNVKFSQLTQQDSITNCFCLNLSFEVLQDFAPMFSAYNSKESNRIAFGKRLSRLGFALFGSTWVSAS